MSTAGWLLVSVAVLLVVYAGFVLALFLLGRRLEARAWIRFIPDCIVLGRRLLADEALPRRRKLALVAMLGYLAMPIDLVPDFVPVAGQLDDAILVAVTLRYVLRGGGSQMLRERWPGPEPTVAALERLAFGRSDGAA